MPSALSLAETIGPERAKMAEFWASAKTSKSARTLGNPNEYAGVVKKIQPDEGLDFVCGGAGGI